MITECGVMNPQMEINVIKIRKPISIVKKYHQSLLDTNRFTIICINSKLRTIIMKDNKTQKIVEVCVLKYLEKQFGLYCISCRTPKCDHTIFSFYTEEILKLKKLGDKISIPEPIRIRLELLKDRQYVKMILCRNIIPAVIFTALSLGLLPFFPGMDTNSWYTIDELENAISISHS